MRTGEKETEQSKTAVSVVCIGQPQVVCSLIRAAHESGAIVCADTKIPTFRSMSLNDLAPVLPMIDYIFPNDTEAAFLTGIKGQPAARSGLQGMLRGGP